MKSGKANTKTKPSQIRKKNTKHTHTHTHTHAHTKQLKQWSSTPYSHNVEMSWPLCHSHT